MSDFCKNCPSDALTQHPNQVIDQLLEASMIKEGSQTLTIRVLIALASIATSSPGLMQEYYATVFPYLKVLKMKAAVEQDHTILAATIDCIINIWLATGKDKIGKDIDLVVETLIFTDGSKLPWGDPMRVAVLKAWGTLCKCLGQDFQPHLMVAGPRLLQSARLDLAFVKSAVLVEKALACKVLCIWVSELEEDFYLWIDEVAETLVPLLDFDSHEEIRVTAVSGMPIVLKSYKAAVDKKLLKQSLLENICSNIASSLLQALDKETSNKFILFILDLLEECLKMSGPILNAGQIWHFLDVTMKGLRACSSFSGSREDLEQADKVSNKFVQSLITLMKKHNAFSKQFFDRLQSCMSQMWDKDENVKQRKITLHIFRNVAERYREEAFKYLGSSLPLLFEACTNQNPEIRQVVAQAIGFSAEFGGSIFLGHVKEAVVGLHAIIILPKESLEKCRAHDAAVSALGKIFFFHLDRIIAAEDFDLDLDLLLSHLPIKCYAEEAKVAHEQFFSTVSKLAERYDFFSRDKTRLSKIIAIFAEILWDEVHIATEESVRRGIEVLEEIKDWLPPCIWASALSSLKPHIYFHLKRRLSS
ncbi:hypothetical protein Tsubulata_016696 [Turnera subulata]|uniref:Uncharacterized protein n=1 Tax=Turnera subulata TaxID=218843 RepID=A0A9Q0FZ79_9ROSI|nr:hypothetical protein Tsubulata_016696 [Turnera subulata]